MYSSLVCTRAPKHLALTLEEVKGYLRINHNDDDALLTQLIKAVSKLCEAYTGISLINQEWQVLYEDFFNRRMTLPTRPVYRINYIELVSPYHKSTPLLRHQYELHLETGEIRFSLPFASHHIRVNFSAGFGETAEDVPQEIRLIMCGHIAFLLETRGSDRQFPMYLYDNFKSYKL